MKKIVMVTCLLLASFLEVNGQGVVKGIILENNSKKPLKGVLVKIRNTPKNQTTDLNGSFVFKNFQSRKAILELRLVGYETQNIPIELSENVLDLGSIFLFKTVTENQDLSLITLTDDELNDDASSADNISGLLQASKDIFLRTAAYEFSSSFFKIKGLDSGNGKVLINGIEMNKIYDGRAQWGNWGGLNDVLRNQEFRNGLTPSDVTFGGLLGATNMNTRASEQRPGIRVSYSSSNRSYQHRIMATYSTGMLKNNWAFTFSGSRRIGTEGYNDATSYNAYAFFTSIEKKLNDKSSINFTGIFTPNRRGKASPNTQEVFDLKGIKYNDYWGFLNGKKVNSRIKEVSEPILMLNHYWNISEKTAINTNVSYQFGKIGNSRIDYNGGVNPSAAYYQNLPSYFLRYDDFEGAYDAENNFVNDGQINWNRVFDANKTNNNSGLENAYVLYEDRNNDKQFTINTILNTEVNDHISINGKIEYRRLNSHNFASVIDLLGGDAYLDIDPFGATEEEKQNDLLNPNRIVREGDDFKYNFNLNSTIISAFTQTQFRYNKTDFYAALKVSNTTHQREGLYKNGSFSENSLGMSEAQKFMNYGFKTGVTYKITGRHLVDINAAYITTAPTTRNTFSNSRENNNVVLDLQSEKTLSTDVSYVYRSPIITSKFTAYYTSVKDATEISFYFADGVGGDNTAFVQEILSGISKKHMGLELGLEAQVTASLNLKGAAAIGQFTYDNNPNLYLTTEADNESLVAGFVNGFKNFGTTNLKNYKLAAGPQNAYSVGFEYRDPSYWWGGATLNFFSNTFIDISPLNRSQNFYLDDDGLPFLEYETEIAQGLLKQEKFDNYSVVNLVGGKSFLINGYYISVFATVNNLLNKTYKSGGFEQGRNANYRQLLEDKSLDKPVFGNKYWYGRGATYFMNVSVSF
ncbi:carboxypeptidase-like regulatory domain-containing protein [Polaribacter sp. R2A056_3_33]|uniref:carboxypeptidase-like regulatory domain-containing protein n=1 Tax=Polaribacter sp. R2A056_3_33 TaxID=2745563 RepID=UPI001C4FB152|nr:carboxypeptidase-like regulatory domain-containing protein [Polaribacter sp. R2A056_3_33]QXP71392.1 carboxypeptidase-like regulatory domain-containing protein [Polaribacter sp. R2A056_3_33]